MKRLLALGALLSGIVFLNPVFSPVPAFAQDEEPAATSPEAGSEEAGEEAEASDEEAAEAAPEMTYEEIPQETQVWYAITNIMLFICAVLVLFMQAGFSMVESGFNASKNTVNILFKNAMDLCIGALLFWLVGFNLMYPGDGGNGWFKWGGLFPAETLAAADVTGGTMFPQADFLFQVAFAATAATIVSGAVAGRMKFTGYLVYSAVLTAIIYPISGYWKWGGGWLNERGFHDFAGSLVVHACGGFAGLAGAILLGPRIGKFNETTGKAQAMPGHNLTVASLGVFILWVGWFGFNPGSQLDFSSAANINATLLIAVNTLMAAAAGGFLAMVTSWCMFGKPDLSMALNGILAGLVGITANCDCVTNLESVIIGAVAGVLVVLGIIFLDMVKIDDPVGAWPVHGLCGIWGGIATGIFGADKDMMAQIIGSIAIPIWAFATMFVLFLVLKVVGLLRVSPEEEMKGLDLCEHGMHAYEQPT